MFTSNSIRFVAASLGVALLIFATSGQAQDIRQDPNEAQNAKLQSTKQKGNDTSCGSINDIAYKVQFCAKPLMDILTGSITKWPRNDQDAKEICESFVGSERCIRDVGRRCAKGLQKTIISTLANSIGRARKRECTTAKFPGITKTLMCIEKNQALTHDLMANVTGRLSVIETKFVDLDRKMSGICCMVKMIEDEIRALFHPKCPTESQTVIRLYRGVLEDVIQLICQHPKCNDLFKGYKLTKSTDYESLISTLLRIVFSLG